MTEEQDKKRAGIIFKGFVVFLHLLVIVLLVALAPRITFLADAWRQITGSQKVAERTLEDPFIQYDERLGWRHIPNKRVIIEDTFPDFDMGVWIDSRGLRVGLDEDDPQKPKIVAVGDSFTFGHVNYEFTWVDLLEKKLGAHEVLNMGTNAYGIDQMYLWYKEIGHKLGAEVVICGVLPNNIRRAFFHKWLSGYGKPVFKLEGDKLVLNNVPVPKPVGKGAENEHPLDQSFQEVEEDPKLVFAIIDEFRKLVERQGAKFVLLYQPTKGELDFDRWYRTALVEYAQRESVLFLDLTPTFRSKLGYTERSWITRVVTRIFGWEDPGIFQPDLHYNERGNELAAEEIARFLEANVLAG